MYLKESFAFQQRLDFFVEGASDKDARNALAVCEVYVKGAGDVLDILDV